MSAHCPCHPGNTVCALRSVSLTTHHLAQELLHHQPGMRSQNLYPEKAEVTLGPAESAMGTSNIYTAHRDAQAPPLELRCRTWSQRLLRSAQADRRRLGRGGQGARLGADGAAGFGVTGHCQLLFFCREHFFHWQPHGNPLPLRSTPQHQNLYFFQYHLRPFLQSAELPRETNCLVSHYCPKPETAWGPRVQKHHQVAATNRSLSCIPGLA